MRPPAALPMATPAWMRARRSGRLAAAAGACLLAAALPAAARASGTPGSAARDAAAIGAALRDGVRVHRFPPADAARDRGSVRFALGTVRRLARAGEMRRAGDLADALHEIANLAR